MRYHCDGYTEQYLSGGTVTVAYNPDDVTSVGVLENGVYTEFTIIESRFEGKALDAVQDLQSVQKTIVKETVKDNLQAQINLAGHIEAIAHSVGGQKVSVDSMKSKITVDGMDMPAVEENSEFTIAGLVSIVKNEDMDIVQLLKGHLPVVEVTI